MFFDDDRKSFTRRLREDIDLDDGSTFDTPEELVLAAFNSLLWLASWHKINAEISP